MRIQFVTWCLNLRMITTRNYSSQLRIKKYLLITQSFLFQLMGIVTLLYIVGVKIMTENMYTRKRHLNYILRQIQDIHIM